MRVSGAINVFYPAAAVILLLSITACDSEQDHNYSGTPNAEPSALAKEYILASQRGYFYLASAHSWKSVSDQLRDNQNMHVETELQCPDRYHMKITGAVDMERFIVGTTKYERRNDGAWGVTDVGTSVAQFSHCKNLTEMRKRLPPDAAQVELIAGEYREMQVSKGPERTYREVKCQEYTVRFPPGPPMTSCYAKEGKPFRVAYSNGKFTEVVSDIDAPLKIEAPNIESQTSTAH